MAVKHMWDFNTHFIHVAQKIHEGNANKQ